MCSESLNIEELITRVEIFQEQQELEVLARLNAENSWLQRKLVEAERFDTNIQKLLEEVCETLEFIKAILSKYLDGVLRAEKEWLLFWGIKIEEASYYYLSYI